MSNNFAKIEIEKTKNIRDIAYITLRRAILEGTIESGEKIVEKDFADLLNVSRTPIREAIRRLESEHLVEYIPRRGVIAKGLTLDDIEEIYEIRKALESLSIEHLILNLNEDCIGKLTLVREEMIELEKLGYIKELYNKSTELHQVIIDCCPMPRLKELISDLQEFYYKKSTTSVRSRYKDATEEHIELYNAIMDRDIARAKRTIEHHTDNSKFILMSLYGKKSIRQE